MYPKARRRADADESSPTSYGPTMRPDATQAAEASNDRRVLRCGIGIEASLERLVRVPSAKRITQVLCRIFINNLAVFGNLHPRNDGIDS